MFIYNSSKYIINHKSLDKSSNLDNHITIKLQLFYLRITARVLERFLKKYNHNTSKQFKTR